MYIDFQQALHSPAEEVVDGEAKRAPQRRGLGDLEAAATGEHEHACEAVDHGQLGGRNGSLLGVDERHFVNPKWGSCSPPVLVEKTSKQEGPVGGTTHEVDRLKQNWRKLTGVVRDGKPRRRLHSVLGRG
jgi:hypothetical protein